jgi:molybdopterin synthase sulfur carrier subunit
MLNVRIPGLLRSYTNGAERVSLQLPQREATLAEVLKTLDSKYPGFRFRIIDEQGAVRPHIKLFVDTVLVRDLGAALQPDSELMIVGALSGG